jgi:CRP-like cAMP-binding protein
VSWSRHVFASESKGYKTRSLRRVRLARCLINLFEGYGQRKAKPPYRVRVSQERLGMMLSLTRQTVNELLREMEQGSIIQSSGWSSYRPRRPAQGGGAASA